MRSVIAWAGLLLGLAACSGEPNGALESHGSSSKSAEAGARAPKEADDPPPPPVAETEVAPSSPPMAAEKPAAPPMAAPSMPTPMSSPQTPAAPAAPAGIAPPEGFKPRAMNECDLHTKWPGDEYCILPPPPDKGFQLHIGPANYDNPEATYLLQPGQESTHAFMTTSANDRDIQFYVRQYRMRPGAHHTIVRDVSTGRRLSGSNVNQDHPVDGIIAPENAGIGVPLVAHAPITVDHHAINTTEEPLLQEVWVNFWYVDPAKVKETTQLLYDPGSVSATVAPHADVVLGPYECDIKQPGRLISMFGHVHANNVRFSAWRTRQGKRELIYEGYHWEDPLWLEFTSLAKNQSADPERRIGGGWSGVLDLEAGDTLGWECHEVNQQDTTLRFTNQTFTGQMCIIIGDLVGTKCQSRNPNAVVNPNLE